MHVKLRQISYMNNELVYNHNNFLENISGDTVTL